MWLRILNIDVPLIKVNITDGRRLIVLYIGMIVYFFTASKGGRGMVVPMILSVNILIDKSGFQ